MHQKPSSTGTCEDDGIRLYDPIEIGVLGTQKELETTLKVLNDYQKTINFRLDDMKNQLAELCSKLYTKFIGKMEIPYQLHAILIHDGTAESGHYYAFIYDRV